MRKSDLGECGLLHATRGECGRFSVRLNHRLIEKQGVNGGLSILSLDILSRHAELATSTSLVPWFALNRPHRRPLT
jgi:hypothetical protein